ncbi:hypothetical protein [Novosphingobium sp. Gsoil 351]|uniref:hypothetical protein n=1 Tax=Novosphingobium sp. Gsoil 351 TaxID=2675225 RepID=UPI0012B48524|nr:hypothetical protein [Novosphingobium sp. Gsoil 351]QGN55084.1 hypothetical protein GKE62_11490 [Novosphingobium sp. Gsoil 351]
MGFIASRTVLQVYEKSAACFRHYTDPWQRCVVPATPTDGATIDQEVRVVVGNPLAKLVSAGILATS